MTKVDYSVEGPIGQALIEKQDQDPNWWADMARDVFGLSLRDAKLLMIEGVLEKIEETNRSYYVGSVEHHCIGNSAYTIEVES